MEREEVRSLHFFAIVRFEDPLRPSFSLSLSSFSRAYPFALVALPKRVVLVLADGLEGEHAGLLEAVQQVAWSKGKGQGQDRVETYWPRVMMPRF